MVVEAMQMYQKCIMLLKVISNTIKLVLIIPLYDSMFHRLKIRKMLQMSRSTYALWWQNTKANISITLDTAHEQQVI